MTFPPRGSRVTIAATALATVAVLCASLLLTAPAQAGQATRLSGQWSDTTVRASHDVAVRGSAVRRAARGNPRAFAFISRRRAGDPIARWNPCRPIGYRVNSRLAGRGALADAKEAVARIRRATGLRLRYRGRTRIVPGGRGDRSYPRDTQLVVAWARPAQSRYLDGARVAGMGGPRWVQWREGRRTKAMITKGFAVLNARLDLAGGFRGGVRNGYHGSRGQLLMHEIGHAIGLDHPRQDDRWQIMYHTMTRKRAVWGAGDRRGLARLGAARGCLAPPSYQGLAGSTVMASLRH